MAKKKKKTTKQAASGTRRKRRSAEEIIADLQKQIAMVKARATASNLKQSAAIKAALAAVRAIDKGLKAAQEEDNTTLRHVLADSREPLANFLSEQGIKLPKTRRPKGPRPKSTS